MVWRPTCSTLSYKAFKFSRNRKHTAFIADKNEFTNPSWFTHIGSIMHSWLRRKKNLHDIKRKKNEYNLNYLNRRYLLKRAVILKVRVLFVLHANIYEINHAMMGLLPVLRDSNPIWVTPFAKRLKTWNTEKIQLGCICHI